MTDDWGEPRSKTVTWYDPVRAAAAGARLSGLEHLRAMAAGELPAPPIGELFGMTVGAVEPGRVEFRVTPDESSYNPIGLVHGGLVCTLLDSVAGCAVQTTLPAGTGYTSIEIKVNYLRPVRAGAVLTAVGTVRKPGSRIAFAEAVVSDTDGRDVATATSTLLIFELPTSPPPVQR